MLLPISKNTKYPKEVAKLLEFLLNDPNGVELMGTTWGVLANTKAIKILKDDKQLTDIDLDSYNFLKNTTCVTESPYLEQFPVTETEISVFDKFDLGKNTDSAKSLKDN